MPDKGSRPTRNTVISLVSMAADAQQGAMGAYEAYNPYMQAEQDRITRGLDRRAAATGNRGSGLNALAQARALDESSFRNYSDYLNRLQGQGQMGLGVDSALAGLDMGNAGNMAEAEQWFRGGQNRQSKRTTRQRTGGVKH